MLTALLGIVAACAILAYVPLVLVFLHRERVIEARRRPIDEVLRDAVGEGRLSIEDFQKAMDEIHASMPTLDVPYPRVREFRSYSRDKRSEKL